MYKRNKKIRQYMNYNFDWRIESRKQAVSQTCSLYTLLLLLYYNYTRKSPSTKFSIWICPPIQQFSWWGSCQNSQLNRKKTQKKKNQILYYRKMNWILTKGGLDLCTWFHGTVRLQTLQCLPEALCSGVEELAKQIWWSRNQTAYLAVRDWAKY